MGSQNAETLCAFPWQGLADKICCLMRVCAWHCHSLLVEECSAGLRNLAASFAAARRLALTQCHADLSLLQSEMITSVNGCDPNIKDYKKGTKASIPEREDMRCRRSSASTRVGRCVAQ